LLYVYPRLTVAGDSPNIYLNSGNDDSRIYFTDTARYWRGAPGNVIEGYTSSGRRTVIGDYGIGINNALGVGTDPALGWTNGEIRATNEITAYASDARLKDFHGTIKDAVKKVLALNGYYFTENEVAKSLGFNKDAMQVGVSAQEVQAVLPEVVAPAPVNSEYLTVRYERLTPLLIEAVKEQQRTIEELQERIKLLETNNKG